MLWQAFDNPGRCRIWRDAANSQTVKTDHVPPAAGNVGLCMVGFLIVQRKSLEILVERYLSAVECIQLVCGPQRANWFKGFGSQSSSPGSLIKRLRLGFKVVG